MKDGNHIISKIGVLGGLAKQAFMHSLMFQANVVFIFNNHHVDYTLLFGFFFLNNVHCNTYLINLGLWTKVQKCKPKIYNVKY
jgi:hypothetical protein